MDPVGQAANQVASATGYGGVQVRVLKTAENLEAESVLSLVDGAVATMQQTAAVNLSTLGQNVDVQA
ncbi:hypothetical protein [Paludibacterium yongneupense]|uniref:hypothetical protein n=1 Tax=Paludibacterium yongneupense TaxID=400061 RepID=UPI00042045FA|nr:hypothetical protein [Paludibacterium yongneupense]